MKHRSSEEMTRSVAAVAAAVVAVVAVANVAVLLLHRMQLRGTSFIFSILQEKGSHWIITHVFQGGVEA